jgi:hypothetical protein
MQGLTKQTDTNIIKNDYKVTPDGRHLGCRTLTSAQMAAIWAAAHWILLRWPPFGPPHFGFCPDGRHLGCCKLSADGRAAIRQTNISFSATNGT